MQNNTLEMKSKLRLSMEDAKEENGQFLENGKEIYEAMKQLRKEIVLYERKRKVVEQQIDKLRSAFQEYILSIEALESSEMYRRAASPNALNHSRLLKHCHVYMPPELSLKRELSTSLEELIKKAQVEYKHAKGLAETVQVLAKTEDTAQALNTPEIEIEKKFELYEKNVEYAVSKMSYAFLANKVSLELMDRIFQEVEEMYTLSSGHRELCSTLDPIKMYQHSTSENRLSQNITEEVVTVSQIFYEEIERQKRALAEKYRPAKKGAGVEEPAASTGRRLLPRKIGFIVSDTKEKVAGSFVCQFEMEGKTLRGVFYLYKSFLLVQEIVFGWKLLVSKTEIFSQRFSSTSICLEYKTSKITIFCTRKEARMVGRWLLNVSLLDTQEICMGVLKDTPENVLFSMFENRFENQTDITNTAGYTLIESLSKERSIRKRQFSKRIHTKGWGVAVAYKETYIVESKTEEEVAVIIYSEVRIPVVSLCFSGISKIKLVKNQESTEVFYSFRKATTESVFRIFTQTLIQDALISLHLIPIQENKGTVLYTTQYGFKEFLLMGGVVALLSILATTGLFYKLVRILLLE
ncbi:hypothetical protein NECID01_0514 [Nematocida sp. AWRm77]|nr:hypothetical protein NECID01_0514 [Nematocida sp. AWRm77]